MHPYYSNLARQQEFQNLFGQANESILFSDGDGTYLQGISYAASPLQRVRMDINPLSLSEEQLAAAGLVRSDYVTEPMNVFVDPRVVEAQAQMVRDPNTRYLFFANTGRSYEQLQEIYVTNSKMALEDFRLLPAITDHGERLTIDGESFEVLPWRQDEREFFAAANKKLRETVARNIGDVLRQHGYADLPGMSLDSTVVEEKAYSTTILVRGLFERLGLPDIEPKDVIDPDTLEGEKRQQALEKILEGKAKNLHQLSPEERTAYDVMVTLRDAIEEFTASSQNPQREGKPSFKCSRELYSYELCRNDIDKGLGMELALKKLKEKGVNFTTVGFSCDSLVKNGQPGTDLAGANYLFLRVPEEYPGVRPYLVQIHPLERDIKGQPVCRDDAFVVSPQGNPAPDPARFFPKTYSYQPNLILPSTTMYCGVLADTLNQRIQSERAIHEVPEHSAGAVRGAFIPAISPQGPAPL